MQRCHHLHHHVQHGINQCEQIERQAHMIHQRFVEFHQSIDNDDKLSYIRIRTLFLFQSRLNILFKLSF